MGLLAHRWLTNGLLESKPPDERLTRERGFEEQATAHFLRQHKAARNAERGKMRAQRPSWNFTAGHRIVNRNNGTPGIPRIPAALGSIGALHVRLLSASHCPRSFGLFD